MLKGLPFGKQSYEHSQCSDIGAAAKRFPDVKFLVYHSGFVSTVREQAFQHDAKRDGIDTLIGSLIENGVKPGSNVYAELGSTWRFLMRDQPHFRTCGPKTRREFLDLPASFLRRARMLNPALRERIIG